MAAAVRRNIQRSANYVLAVVLFAVALFFAGMSAKLRGAGTRKALLVVGCLVFVGTAAWIATFPVILSVWRDQSRGRQSLNARSRCPCA